MTNIGDEYDGPTDFQEFRSWYFKQEGSGSVADCSKEWTALKQRRADSGDQGTGESDAGGRAGSADKRRVEGDPVASVDSGAGADDRGAGGPGASADVDRGADPDGSGEGTAANAEPVRFEPADEDAEILKAKPEERPDPEVMEEARSDEGGAESADTVEIGPTTPVQTYVKLISKVHRAAARWIKSSTDGAVEVSGEELRDLDDSGGAVLQKYDRSGWLRKLGHELAYVFGWVLVIWRWIDANTRQESAQDQEQQKKPATSSRSDRSKQKTPKPKRNQERPKSSL